MHPEIAISTGGSIELMDALYPQLYVCPEIDDAWAVFSGNSFCLM